jgi:putative membrane protein
VICKAGPRYSQIASADFSAGLLTNHPQDDTMSPLFALLHHLSAFTMVAALAVEFVLVRDDLTLGNARKVLIADAVYGASAGILIVVGFLRVFYFEKGATYYFHTWTFIAKLSLFIIIGVVSIVPTIAFLSWRKAVKQGQVPSMDARKMRSLRSIIHLELAGVVLILLMAALMAKGVGLML